MRRPVVRVFARCSNLFALDGDMPGYDEAWDFVRDTCKRYGVYFSPVIFVDNYPEKGNVPALDTDDKQQAWFDRLTTRSDVRDPVYLWSIVNEPEQKWQGYDGPCDPRLFAFADTLAQRLGHRDFIIGAAPDGDDVDASKQTVAWSVEIARHCNIVVIHDSRKGGYFPQPDGRMRRWVDHIEAFVDVVDACREVNDHAYGYHEEPPGHASVESVPLPDGGVYHREWDAECAVAGALTAECTGTGYCYHRIRTQDPGTPGLSEIAAIIAEFPAAGDYRNDSWPGSPSNGFTDANGHEIEGKTRHAVWGADARTLSYSQAGVPVIEWANGYGPVDPALYRGPRVLVTKAHQ